MYAQRFRKEFDSCLTLPSIPLLTYVSISFPSWNKCFAHYTYHVLIDARTVYDWCLHQQQKPRTFSPPYVCIILDMRDSNAMAVTLCAMLISSFRIWRQAVCFYLVSLPLMKYNMLQRNLLDLFDEGLLIWMAIICFIQLCLSKNVQFNRIIGGLNKQQNVIWRPQF